MDPTTFNSALQYMMIIPWRGFLLYGGNISAVMCFIGNVMAMTAPKGQPTGFIGVFLACPLMSFGAFYGAITGDPRFLLAGFALQWGALQLMPK